MPFKHMQLVGTWVQIRDEGDTTNLQKLFNVMDVSKKDQKEALEWLTELDIKYFNGTWSITTLAGDRRRIAVFPANTIISTYNLEEQPCKAKLTVNPDYLMEKQQTKTGVFDIMRSIENGRLKTTLYFGDMKCSIFFERTPID